MGPTQSCWSLESSNFFLWLGPIFCQQMNGGIAHKNCLHMSSTNDSVEGKKKWSISVCKMPIAIMHVERKQKWSIKCYYDALVLGQFDTNYVIFRNFQIFKKENLKIFFSEGNSRI